MGRPGATRKRCLIPEEQEENDQRAPHQVVVEVFSQQAELINALISKFMVGHPFFMVLWF